MRDYIHAMKELMKTTSRPISASLQGLAVKEDVRKRLQACIEEAQQEQGH